MHNYQDLAARAIGSGPWLVITQHETWDGRPCEPYLERYKTRAEAGAEVNWRTGNGDLAEIINLRKVPTPQ